MAAPCAPYIVRSPEAGFFPLTIAFAVGATGAVGAIQGGGKRAKEFLKTTPVVRTGVGVYDIFLKAGWLALLGYNATTTGTLDSTAGTYGKVTTDNVATSASPKVSVTYLRPDTGVAADPRSGDVAIVTLFLKGLKPD
jgi:hypothetical protein